MDCFYIITNKLKDPDFAITNEIKRYIESKGKVCYISEKTARAILYLAQFLTMRSAALSSRRRYPDPCST